MISLSPDSPRRTRPEFSLVLHLSNQYWLFAAGSGRLSVQSQLPTGKRFRLLTTHTFLHTRTRHNPPPPNFTMHPYQRSISSPHDLTDWQVVTHADAEADADIGHNPRSIYEYRPTRYLCRGEVTKATVLDPVEPAPPAPPAAPPSRSSDYMQHNDYTRARNESYSESVIGGYEPSSPVPMYSYASPYTADLRGTPSTSTCLECGTTFSGVWAARNLSRHMEDRHGWRAGSGSAGKVCPVDGCGREFRREDALKVHIRKSHGEMGRA
jgi:uncharacterized C2H2 Zn-finger protein